MSGTYAVSARPLACTLSSLLPLVLFPSCFLPVGRPPQSSSGAAKSAPPVVGPQGPGWSSTLDLLQVRTKSRRHPSRRNSNPSVLGGRRGGGKQKTEPADPALSHFWAGWPAGPNLPRDGARPGDGVGEDKSLANSNWGVSQKDLCCKVLCYQDSGQSKGGAGHGPARESWTEPAQAALRSYYTTALRLRLPSLPVYTLCLRYVGERGTLPRPLCKIRPPNPGIALLPTPLFPYGQTRGCRVLRFPPAVGLINPRFTALPQWTRGARGSSWSGVAAILVLALAGAPGSRLRG